MNIPKQFAHVESQIFFIILSFTKIDLDSHKIPHTHTHIYTQTHKILMNNKKVHINLRNLMKTLYYL